MGRRSWSCSKEKKREILEAGEGVEKTTKPTEVPEHLRLTIKKETIQRKRVKKQDLERRVKLEFVCIGTSTTYTLAANLRKCDRKKEDGALART